MLSAILLYLTLSFNLLYRRSSIEGTSNIGLPRVVYVSRFRGKTGSDSCGSKSLPCKTLQVGIDKLAWGGRLYVDGEQTSTDPYTCQSSSERIVVQRNLSIQSYKATAHISCANGFKMTANGVSTGMNVTLTGLHFNNTAVYFRDTSVVIVDCIFVASSPAINVKISNGFPLYSLDIKNTMFKNNQGCIQVDVEQGRGCNRVMMDLRDIVFNNNTIPLRSGSTANGLIFVKNENCCCQEISLFSIWKNLTVHNNQGIVTQSDNIDQKKKKRCFEKGSLDTISNSFFVAHACTVNLTFSRVASSNNTNMRFLESQSQENYIHIDKSSYHGHKIGNPGGVMHIKGNKINGAFVDVAIKITDSVFSHNVGTLGGVLQVEGGKDKVVVLKMSNVTFFNSYGSTECGCGAVSVGHPCPIPAPSVAKIFATFDGIKVYKCHKPQKICNKCQPAICLISREIIKIVIEHSKFFRNKNQALLILYSPNDELSTERIIDVTIYNTTFIENSFTGVERPTLNLIVQPSHQNLEKSILNISKTLFLQNIGNAAIDAQKIVEVYVRYLTCNGTFGVCLNIDFGDWNNKTPAFNSELHIENSFFINNTVPFSLINRKPKFINICLRNTIFYKNVFPKHSHNPTIRVGSKENDALYSGNILLENLFFSSNIIRHAHSSAFGILVAGHEGNFSVVVRNSIFKDNFHEIRVNNTAFINLFYFYIPHRWSRNDFHKGDRAKCPKDLFQYNNSITFENVTFENNTCVTSILYLNSGKTSFHRCLFKDNFSFQPEIGAHVFFEKGATSGSFNDTRFIQTRKNPKEHRKDYTLAPFVYFNAQGPLELRNTTFTIDVSISVTAPVFILQYGHFVFLDRKTTYLCPVGSYLKLYNASHVLRSGLSKYNCALNIKRLRFMCKLCPVSTYSLQRGSFNASKKHNVYVKCLKCPFGAQCALQRNIKSRPNFWGYKASDNPPQLLFEKCPDGYCIQPKSNSNFSIYNECSGKRTGIMCGACKKGFSESMFNHKCRRNNDCNDGWFWVIAGLYSVVIAVFVLCQPSLILFLVRKILWFTKKSATVPNSRVEQMHKAHNHDGHAYFKIIFYFYQVAELIMLESCSEILPKVRFLSSITSFYNFEIELADSSFGCPFPGLTAVTKELFRSLHVFATMVVIVLFYFFHWFQRLIRKRQRPLFAPYLASIIEVLLLGYERLGHTSLKLLNCTPLDMLGNVEWRLVLDANITCWVHWWQYALIGYNIIFVIPFLFVLFVGTTKLRRQEISAFHFIASCFVPLPFLIYWMVRRCWRYDSQKGIVSRDQNHNDQERRHALLEVLQGPFRSPNGQSKGALYWESILIGRRLVFLCLLSFTATLMLRLLLMTLVCMLIFIHNVIVMPYKDRKANLFALVLLAIHVVMATINLSESVLINAGVTSDGPLKSQIDGLKIFELVLLSALPCAFVLLVVAVVFSQTVRLLLVVGHKCLQREGTNRQHASYQPLLNPSEDNQTFLK